VRSKQARTRATRRPALESPSRVHGCMQRRCGSSTLAPAQHAMATAVAVECTSSRRSPRGGDACRQSHALPVFPSMTMKPPTAKPIARNLPSGLKHALRARSCTQLAAVQHPPLVHVPQPQSPSPRARRWPPCAARRTSRRGLACYNLAIELPRLFRAHVKLENLEDLSQTSSCVPSMHRLLTHGALPS